MSKNAINIAQIEISLQKVVKDFSEDTFIYDLLLAYGTPYASIKKLQIGSLNLSKKEGEICWKKKLLYKVEREEDLHEVIDDLKADTDVLKHEPRFIIVTDFETLLAVDRKTNDTLDIPILEIAKYYDFFLPWAGMEKAQHQSENPADVKAAVKMAKLYDEIEQDNPTTTPEEVHNLNVFLSRLLFCFFAEDTGIFPVEGQFTNAISSHTQADGSDLHTYLDTLFEILNTEKRGNIPAYLNKFPYVNGGLFNSEYNAPRFTRNSRKALIESGTLNWSEINPDIFGSMMQAVIDPEHRSGMGMHYTSVPNIMKVIEPLFLNELNEEFEKGKYEPKRLNALLERMGRLKIFDPACGSGNFLIIAYKELRTLEIKILKQLQELSSIASGFEPKQLELIPKAQLRLAKTFKPTLFTRVELSQFYGIELDDFAHELAILSLWLAQHQMNAKFKAVFGDCNPTLPLRQGGNIVHGNATRLDWKVVCPIRNNDEIYVLGNPPYLGSRNQEAIQKDDMKFIFKTDYKSLDYIACWLIKAANYIKGINAQFAFVSTNSICQGEQIAFIWPKIFANDLEIGFAHQSFKWTNNAKNKANVIVIIVGVRNLSSKEKKLYSGSTYSIVKNINPYLTEGNSVYISRRSKPLSSGFEKIVYGNLLNDGGHLILNSDERSKLLNKFPSAKKFIKEYIGSREYLRGEVRWCLHILDEDLKEAEKIPEIKQRLELVRKVRSKSSEKSTVAIADTPNRYYFTSYNGTNSILVPRTSSERREYIPIGFLTPEIIISDAAQAIYNASPLTFGIISSRMHMTWMRAVAGRLKTDYRYSSALVYNTFPFPSISQTQKESIEHHVFNVLSEREKHSEKTLSQLYDPDEMPRELKEAHAQLDLAIERCYRSKPFESDEERLEYLFRLFEKMIDEEKEQNGELIFDKPTKKKTKQKKHA